MYQILLVIHVLLTLALIVSILVQRSSNDGFGMGSGSGGNLMTGRASANLLTRVTAIAATLFIVNSLALGILTQDGTRSITDEVMQLDGQAVEAIDGAVQPAAAENAQEKTSDDPAQGDDSAPAGTEQEETIPEVSVPRPGME